MSDGTAVRGPLSGVRIIEIAGIGALPFAGMLLADMGAEILRIDPPRARELHMADDDPVMRGRAALALNLKDAADRERALDLIEHADVLLEALRPGKMEALGLGPDACLARSPGLVYARSTGWGQAGPLTATAGHDPNYVGYTGALDWLGRTGNPPMPPFGLVGDTAGGSLYVVIGILAALHHARTTGQGQVVDASILDGTLSLMTGIYAAHRSGLMDVPHWQGMMVTGDCPYTGVYETADGRHVSVCALERPFYDQLLAGLGLDGSALPDRNDIASWPALREKFAECFRSADRDHWEAVFAASDACVSPILSLEEAAGHPANIARDAFIDGLPAPAPRFSATRTAPAPASIATDELLARWQSSPTG